MSFRFLCEKPFCSGSSFFRSVANLGRTPAPQPSCFCRSAIMRPIVPIQKQHFGIRGKSGTLLGCADTGFDVAEKTSVKFKFFYLHQLSAENRMWAEEPDASRRVSGTLLKIVCFKIIPMCPFCCPKVSLPLQPDQLTLLPQSSKHEFRGSMINSARSRSICSLFTSSSRRATLAFLPAFPCCA